MCRSRCEAALARADGDVGRATEELLVEGFDIHLNNTEVRTYVDCKHTGVNLCCRVPTFLAGSDFGHPRFRTPEPTPAPASWGRLLLQAIKDGSRLLQATPT